MSTPTLKNPPSLSNELSIYEVAATFWKLPESLVDEPETYLIYRMARKFVVDGVLYDPNHRQINTPAFFNVKDDFTYDHYEEEGEGWDSSFSHIHNCQSCGVPYEMDEYEFLHCNRYACKVCHEWG